MSDLAETHQYQGPERRARAAASETIGAISTALASFQGELKQAKKESSNPHFGSKYADLATVWDTIRAPLAKNALSVVQMTDYAGGDLTLRSRLLHKSGEWFESTYPIAPERKTPQGYGSAMTYARRYTLAALLGVSQDDDDGEASMVRAPAKPKESASDFLRNSKPAAAKAAATKPKVEEDKWPCEACGATNDNDHAPNCPGVT